MAEQWHGVNELGASFSKPRKKEDPKPIEDAFEDDESPHKKEDPEIELVSGTWVIPTEGCQFNKPCGIEVKARYLKKTNRRMISIDVFVIHKNKEENLNQPLEAYLDDDGVATSEAKLYYGSDYSKELGKDPLATCQYKFKVKHSTARKPLESKLLSMPKSQKKIRFIDIHDVEYQQIGFKLEDGANVDGPKNVAIIGKKTEPRFADLALNWSKTVHDSALV